MGVHAKHNIRQASRRRPPNETPASARGCVTDRLQTVSRRGRRRVERIGVRPGNSRLRRCHVASGSFSLLILMVVSACAGANAETASDNSDVPTQSKSIMQCRLNAVAEPLARIPDALEKAARVYQVFNSTENAVGAFESVYGKSLPVFTYDEQAEALLILSGLDSCGEASATAPEAIVLLLSGQPNSGTATSGPGNPPDQPNNMPDQPNNMPDQPNNMPDQPDNPPDQPDNPPDQPDNAPDPPDNPPDQPDNAPDPPDNPPDQPDNMPDQPDNPPNPPDNPRKPKPSKPYSGQPMQMGICTSPKGWEAGSPSCVPVHMLPGDNSQQETTGRG